MRWRLSCNKMLASNRVRRERAHELIRENNTVLFSETREILKIIQTLYSTHTCQFSAIVIMMPQSPRIVVAKFTAIAAPQVAVLADWQT